MNTRKERFIVDKEGKKTDVILPINEYKSLLEDLHDLAVIAERRDEKAIPFEEFKTRFHKKYVY